MSDQNKAHSLFRTHSPFQTSAPSNDRISWNSRHARNQRGQGLIEYLIIVALMGVATIAIVRVMGQTVASRFASTTYALQGEKKSFKPKIDESHYKKKDLGDFFDGVSDGKGGN